MLQESGEIDLRWSGNVSSSPKLDILVCCLWANPKYPKSVRERDMPDRLP